MKGYFSQMVSGVSTVFEGMSITLATLFTKTATIEYPDVDVRSDEALRKGGYKGNLRGMPENYRGLLHVDMEICTACMICMRACPIDCIVITNVKCDKRKFNGKSGKPAVQTRAATRFDIDLGKCMFCGLCSEPCPTGAIHHTTEFHFNKGSLAELVVCFVTPEQAALAQKRAAEIESEEKEKKAAEPKDKPAKSKKDDETSEG